MRFDYTKGQKARYIVSVYWDDIVEDHYYFHYFGESLAMYDKLKSDAKEGTHINLYDMVKDIRKKGAFI